MALHLFFTIYRLVVYIIPGWISIQPFLLDSYPDH